AADAWVGSGNPGWRAGLWLARRGVADLPEWTRRNVANRILQAADCLADLSVAAEWLRGLWCHPSVVGGDWPEEDLWVALEHSNAGVATLARVYLRNHLKGGALSLAALERAAWSVHPDLYEAGLPDWLATLKVDRLTGKTLAEALVCIQGREPSRRFQDAVLDHLWPRLSDPVRQEAREWLEEHQRHPRVQRILGRM
ncbi:MAG: hypothetical protein AB1758_25870, partial [Candidatus Eremiobacterota bacterium]